MGKFLDYQLNEAKMLVLTDRNRQDLRNYARNLRLYTCDDIWNVVMFSRAEKSEEAHAHRVKFALDSYNEEYGMYFGTISAKFDSSFWRIKMVWKSGISADYYMKKKYWRVFPIMSDNRVCLDFLAENALSTFFEGETFEVSAIANKES